jgi:hypothetical protein
MSEKGIIMSQQEMDYSEISPDRAGFSYGAYEGTYGHHMSGEKLSFSAARTSATATQRLILAIASLLMFIILTFGLVAVAAASRAEGWVVIPIMLILGLFSAVAIVINVVFNRHP